MGKLNRHAVVPRQCALQNNDNVMHAPTKENKCLTVYMSHYVHFENETYMRIKINLFLENNKQLPIIRRFCCVFFF